MKVLLTGASGFIGHYVLKVLQKNNIETIAIGRNKPCIPVSYIKVDLLNTKDFTVLLQQERPSHLLHLAWYTEHGKYWNSSLNLNWLDITIRLVEDFCINGGQKVVIAGTCAEYDWKYGYCRENSTPLNPLTLYGAAKDAARRLVTAVCAQYKVPNSWGRIFLPFGYGESSERLIPSLIDVFQGHRPPFPINAHIYRDFLHASDVAEGFFSLLTSELSGEFNICSGEPTSLSLVVKNLANLFNSDAESILLLAREKHDTPQLLIGENLKLKTLGWQPKICLVDGLRDYLSNLKN